jgi:hypothetical protein
MIARWSGQMTKRQAEALWVAREVGSALYLHSTSPHSGSFKGMLRGMRDAGMLSDTFTITPAGASLLENWESEHGALFPIITREGVEVLRAKRGKR